MCWKKLEQNSVAFSMTSSLHEYWYGESLRAVHPICPFANTSKLSPGGAGSSSQDLLILGAWWALRFAQPQHQCLTKEMGPALQNSQRKCWRGGEKMFPYGNKILPIIAFLISTVTWPSYIFSSDIRPPSPPNWDRTTIIISQILTDMFLIHTIFKSKKKKYQDSEKNSN